MTSLSEYYEESLYPLQNGVLRAVESCKTRFYLTGGTALSRAYYRHRYSDDLDFFGRIDPVRNILSNKLGAIFRLAGKDVADIREIALHESIDWAEIINEGRQKDKGIELPYIAEILKTIPQAEFEAIHWIKNPGWETFQSDIDKIVFDMMSASVGT